MNITITGIDDQTPKGLTTGFRLHLNCATAAGQPFMMKAAVLVSKDVLTKQIPLPNLVIAALQKSGLEEYVNELFVDSRRLNLDSLSTQEPKMPQTVTLGGVEQLNAKAIEKLTKG
jgi:hypothetical protein